MKERIEYDYFEQELPDRLAFVDLLVEVILSLRHEDKPENRRLLAELDSLAVMEFMEDIKGKDLSEVRNTFAWTRTVFMDFLHSASPGSVPGALLRWYFHRPAILHAEQQNCKTVKLFCWTAYQNCCSDEPLFLKRHFDVFKLDSLDVVNEKNSATKIKPTKSRFD